MTFIERPEPFLDLPEDEEENLPVCDCCGCKINEDYYWDFGNERYCDDCAVSLFRRSVDSYVAEHEPEY